MTINIPPGVFDIIPEDSKEPWRSSYLWNQIEAIMRDTARVFGYQEMRTPVFERTELFQRGVGDTSDIVSKEMYTFLDKGGRSMSLRPEGTAPVIRAFIENKLYQNAPIHKFFYIAPMFRYERSQAGRYRQHHQFGAEAIGNNSPEQDVELIDMIYTLYQRLGLNNLEVFLNSLGDTTSRIDFRNALQEYLRSSFAQLSADSQARFETNPLRILDSKDPNDRKILANAPSILDFLKPECSDHFNEVKKLLGQLKIPFKVNSQLVRGLDYYNRTVFEVICGDLGAQNSIGGGGRYDGLVKLLGGPDLPAIGFGTGLERIIQTILKQNVTMAPMEHPTLFLIALGEESKNACFSIAHNLRRSGVAVYLDFSSRKLNKVMQFANQIQAKYVAVVGENEISTGEVNLKEMKTGESLKAPLFNLTRILQIETYSDEFLRMWQEMSKPFSQQIEAEFFIKKLSHSISDTKQLAQELQTVVEKMQDML